MRILGIDPGTLSTGWGLVEGGPAHPRLVACGAIRVKNAGALPDRLARLQAELTALVERLKPAGAAVEAPFQGSAARSALQLAHARGVALAVLAASGIPIAEYTPATVKLAVTGNGRADKQQIRHMVGRLLGVAEVGGPDDVSDALAVALCHVSRSAYHGTLARRGPSEVPRRRGTGRGRREERSR